MWTIYDIRHDRYWNDQRHEWCDLWHATRFTPQERDRLHLPSLTLQWRYVTPAFLPPLRLATALS